MRKKLDSLKRGTCLDGYELEKTLGGGGFSVVYRARQINNDRKVVITPPSQPAATAIVNPGLID